VVEVEFILSNPSLPGRGDVPFELSATSEGDPSVRTRESGVLRVREQVVQTRRRRWWPLVVLVSVGLLIALIALLLAGGNKTVSVPNVVGLSADQASARLKDMGFSSHTEPRESDEREGTVFSTMPRAGMKLKAGSTVRLFVSSGPGLVSVPDLRGSSLDLGKKRLEQMGFTVGELQEEFDPSVTEGAVTRTDPPADTMRKKGSAITLIISRSPFYVELVKYDKPIAYWRLNEKSGSSLTGDLMDNFDGHYHSVQLEQRGALNHNPKNRAALFDGANSYVDVMPINLKEDFTIEAWVRLNSSGSSLDAIVGQGGVGPDINFYQGFLRVYTGATDAIVTQTPAIPGIYTYWVITRSSGQLAIYRNGKREPASGEWSKSFPIRAIGWGNAGRLNGYLDEVAVYDYPLDARRIAYHYGIAKA